VNGLNLFLGVVLSIAVLIEILRDHPIGPPGTEKLGGILRRVLLVPNEFDDSLVNN
jgi:hypothetical protein